MDKAIRLDPQDAAAYLNRGNAYGALGQYERAIEDLDEAIRLDSQLAMAYNNRGRAYKEVGQYERAIEDYDEAVRLNPQYVNAYLNRGNAYGDLGRYERAIEDYDEAVRLAPRSALLYANRALSYALFGKDKEARQDVERAVVLGFDRGMLGTRIEEMIAAKQRAKDAEWDAVQIAIDIMLADNRLSTVAANGTAAKITAAFDFDFGPGTQNITDYLGAPSTAYCYTWDSTGNILTQADC